ncbi:RNA 2',3'-cyclic phosphodiesterase [[Pseudomonas] boreopolis]|uniref:RNA 2',3'-cyclic phosphodiesterase n=2 Tax=Xanthomonas boreopolis TaxID=86183 RepID=A0A919F787_9XANT|nr:RNA 2',3'-cyclic phosphodiesterase [[Pseudomonas] boreopolis]
MSMTRPFLYLSSADAQLSLGLGEEKPSERLFFAVMPDAETAAAAGRLARDLVGQENLSGKPLAEARLHVTLHHLGDYAGLPPSLLARARAAAERLRMEAFDVRFDRVGTFGGRRRQMPCVLRGEDGVKGLFQLQRTLARRMAEQGIAGDTAFTPHMTLLYTDTALPLRRVEPVQWRAREFVLIRSFLGQTRYQLEGRWPLA